MFILANRTAAKAEALAAELGCNTTTNAEVAGRSDLIFLAVKPQMMEALLAPLKFTLNERAEPLHPLQHGGRAFHPRASRRWRGKITP